MTARERRIIYYVAVSADGFIARSDGAVDWLDRPRKAGDYGMGEFYRSIDTVLLGRKTWEVGVSLGASHFKGKKNYVFSRKRRRFVPEVELVKEPVGKFARRLRGEKGKDIWLVGGGSLFASFLDAGQVDAIRVHVIPTLIGEGIPLVAPSRRNVSLRLISSRDFSDGVVRLDHEIDRRMNIPS